MRALVLAGGGAKIGFTAGVLKQVGIQGYDFIVGTSAGALAAAAVSFIGVDGFIETLGKIKKRSDVFSFAWSNRGVFSSSPLTSIVRGVVTGRAPTIPVWVSSVCLEDCSLFYSKAGEPEFAKMTVASCSLPGAVVPVQHRGLTYVDGGVRENAPVQKAIDLGATSIDVILCNPLRWDSSWDLPSGDMFPAAHYVMRSFDIMGHESMLNDLRPGCKVYAPNQPVCDVLDFDQESLQRGIMLGKVAQYTIV